MSLVISITCAVLATLLQQWARRYLKVTQTRYSLHWRARIRSFYHEGVEKSFLPWAVEALPMLLHVSLVLFFAGLAVFLWNVNITIFKAVLSWIAVCTALYGCTMIISLLRRDSPYYAPLTPLALPFIQLIAFVLFLIPWFCFVVFVVCWEGFSGREWDLKDIDLKLRNWFGSRREDPIFKTPKVAAVAALKSSPSLDLDTRALMFTLERLDEDHELVRFFSALPGFHTSKAVKQPLRHLANEQNLKLLTAIVEFLDRTFSSDLLSDRVKQRRADICEKAIDLLDTLQAFPQIIRKLASEDYSEPALGPVQSTKILKLVRSWGYCKGEDTASPIIRALFSIAVSRVQRHDDSWFILASDEMAIPEAVLRSHDAHGDSLSLVILIHILRQQIIYFRSPSWPYREILSAIKSASKFDVRDTSRELQHEFCPLWNKIQDIQVRGGPIGPAFSLISQEKFNVSVLRDPLRSVFVALHEGTDSALTHIFNLDTIKCNVPSHILDESATTTFSRTLQQHDDTPAIASLTSPDAPSSSVPAPPHVENLAAVPPLDNSQYSHPTHRSVDSVQFSPTSRDASNARAIQDIVASGIDPTPKAPTSPRSSTFPPDVFLQGKADLLAPSDSPNLPSPASGLVLDNTLLTGPSLPKLSHHLI